MEERSITGAARRMFISQPAMSRMFDRLQDMFKDELLVRTSSGYEPTDHGSAIYAEVQQMLPKIEALFGKREFNPAKATGIIRIEASDWSTTVLLSGLIRILADQAPGIVIDVVLRRDGFDRLETNDVDLVLAGSPSLPPDSGKTTDVVRSECLFREKLVCLMRYGHPLAKRRLTLRQYLNAQHIVGSNNTETRRDEIRIKTQPPVKRTLERLGRQPKVKVRVPYVNSLPLIVGNTDLVATIPLHTARRLKTTKTCIVPAPKELGIASLHLVWHSRNDSNPIHAWLRGVLRTLAQEVNRDLRFPPSAARGRILGISHLKGRKI